MAPAYQPQQSQSNRAAPATTPQQPVHRAAPTQPSHAGQKAQQPQRQQQAPNQYNEPSMDFDDDIPF